MRRTAIVAFSLSPVLALAYRGFPPGATDAGLLGGLTWMAPVAGPWIAGSILVERFRGASLLAVAAGTALLGYVLAALLAPALLSFGAAQHVPQVLGLGFITLQLYFAGKLFWVATRPPDSAYAEALPNRGGIITS